AGRFIPLKRIHGSGDLRSFLDDVAPLLHRPEHTKAVQYCLSETIRNVFEHAGGQPAYACAQYYESARRVSIGVADCGIGVRTSLSRHLKLSSDAEALMNALVPGTTGAPRGMYGPSENAGVGLFFTKSIAKASGQYFAIISGDAAYRLRHLRRSDKFRLYVDPRKDRHDLFEGLPSWQGTVVAVDIGLRRTLNFEATMNSIREAIVPEHARKVTPRVKFT
ncbi:MAG: hypothetical protein KGL59_16365, partial [Acidobacteriota bacterium]|nr:hypothetical protein [Acidobacteriota bacterium]